jgi:hypothetical protein
LFRFTSLCVLCAVTFRVHYVSSVLLLRGASLVFGLWFVVWCLVFGVWCLVFGGGIRIVGLMLASASLKLANVAATAAITPLLGWWLLLRGCTSFTLDRSSGKSLGMAIGNADGPTSGVKVLQVTPGGQAALAGVTVGAEILKINGTDCKGYVLLLLKTAPPILFCSFSSSAANYDWTPFGSFRQLYAILLHCLVDVRDCRVPHNHCLVPHIFRPVSYNPSTHEHAPKRPKTHQNAPKSNLIQLCRGNPEHVPPKKHPIGCDAFRLSRSTKRRFDQRKAAGLIVTSEALVIEVLAAGTAVALAGALVITLDRTGGKSLGMAIGNASSPTSGVEVLQVTEGGQADGAGVKAGFQIFTINGCVKCPYGITCDAKIVCCEVLCGKVQRTRHALWMYSPLRAWRCTVQRLSGVLNEVTL